MDLSTVLAAFVVSCIMALAQLGAMKLFLDRTLKTVDGTAEKTEEHAKLIAKTAETLERVQERLDKSDEATKELYASRNDHDKTLTAIETLHEVKGCKVFFQQKAGN